MRPELIINPFDLLWAAGVLEGEGSFYASESPSGKKSCKVGVEMTDLDVVRRLATILGTRVNGPYLRKTNVNPNAKPTFSTKVAARAEVRRVCEIFYPMMGKRRRQQISKVLDIIASWEPAGED